MESPTPQQIKELRTHHRLSREEFGRLVYQTPRAVTGWENDERKMAPALWELVLYKLEGVLPPRAEFYNPNQLTIIE